MCIRILWVFSSYNDHTDTRYVNATRPHHSCVHTHRVHRAVACRSSVSQRAILPRGALHAWSPPRRQGTRRRRWSSPLPKAPSICGAGIDHAVDLQRRTHRRARRRGELSLIWVPTAVDGRLIRIFPTCRNTSRTTPWCVGRGPRGGGGEQTRCTLTGEPK